jgi:uncharacterized protein (TIGR02145 family)
MKKLLLFLVLIYGLQLSAQNYDISFAGTGASTTVGSVKVDNLTASTTLTLTGIDILRLTVVTDVNPIRDSRFSALKIYPNPMTEYSIMEIIPPVEGEAVISVCDMTGKPVAQIQSYLGNLRQDFRFSGLKEGFYLVNVTGKGYQYSGKLVSNVKSGGKLSIQKINSIIQTFEEKTTKTESKGTQATINMAYSIGDRLKFTGSSGNFTTIVMDIPSATKTITFGFADCTDGDNNHYPIVNVGTQVWMAENLKTTRLNDNTTVISNITSNTIWTAQSTPAYCWYNNDVTTYKPLYGGMYNWFALNTGNLCPAGWRVPTDADFNTLEVSLGLPLANVDIYGFRGTDQGAKLKNISGWAAGQNGTNASGFSALPGGYRYGADGSYNAVGLLSYWWTTTLDPNDGTAAWYRRLDGTSSQVYKGTTAKVAGKYVRCVQN